MIKFHNLVAKEIFTTNLRPKKKYQEWKYGKSPKEVFFFERSIAGHPDIFNDNNIFLKIFLKKIFYELHFQFRVSTTFGRPPHRLVDRHQSSSGPAREGPGLQPLGCRPHLISCMFLQMSSPAPPLGGYLGAGSWWIQSRCLVQTTVITK